MTASKRVFSIASISLRRNLPPHLLLSLLVSLIAFLFVAPAYWEEGPTVSFLETMIILTGPILLTPLFLPEQDPAVADVLRARRTPLWAVHAVRAVCSLAFVLLLPALAVLALSLNHCELPENAWLVTVCSSLLLGGLGAFAYSITGNIAAAYMAPALLYALCFVIGNKLGVFNLFLVSTGMEGSKLPQLFLGLLLLALSIPLFSKRR